MKYTFSILLTLFSFIASSQVCEKITEIEKRIQNSKELTFEEFIELDDAIMQLQFDKMNEIFEGLRDQLSAIEIVEVLLPEPEEAQEQIITPGPGIPNISNNKNTVVAPLAGLAAIAKKEIDGKSYDESIEALKKRFLRKELLQIAQQVKYTKSTGNKTELAEWIVRQIRFRE